MKAEGKTYSGVDMNATYCWERGHPCPLACQSTLTFILFISTLS
jgi:hypothetical protein